MNFDSILVVSSIVILCMIYLQYTGYLQNTSKIVTTKHNRSDDTCDPKKRSKIVSADKIGDSQNICYYAGLKKTNCDEYIVKSSDFKDNIPYQVCEWHDVFGCVTENYCTKR